MLVAAPCYTRPESEQWFCSLRLGVLEGDVKSRSLKRAFGWDRPLPGLVLAVQLVSLSMKFEVCVGVVGVYVCGVRSLFFRCGVVGTLLPVWYQTPCICFPLFSCRWYDSRNPVLLITLRVVIKC